MNILLYCTTDCIILYKYLTIIIIIIIILEKVEKAVSNIATNSMMDTAKELNPSPDTVVDVKCMFDGTWQKYGFVSFL